MAGSRNSGEASPRKGEYIDGTVLSVSNFKS